MICDITYDDDDDIDNVDDDIDNIKATHPVEFVQLISYHSLKSNLWILQTKTT